MAPRPLLARLQKDLAELRNAPYPGVAVFTHDDNLRSLCLVLTPPSGPWKDLSLHFDVSLPELWPALPPAISNTVAGIEHPNLYGDFICCDLLQVGVRRGYSGGYSPALTLRGLFLQFLTFFSSTSVEQDTGASIYLGDHVDVKYFLKPDRPHSYSQDVKDLQSLWISLSSPEVLKPDSSPNVHLHTLKTVPCGELHRVEYFNSKWLSTLDILSSWKCRKCPYGSPQLPHHNHNAQQNGLTFPIPPSLLQIPHICALDKLSDDCLYELSHRMTSESLISFSNAYPRFRAVVTAFHVLLRRELKCFFLRVPLNECILGIGVAIDKQARTLSSDFDWLSAEAFDDHYVRLSIEKRPFDFFLPLAFSPANFKRVLPEIWMRLALIDQDLCRAEAEIEKRTRRPSNRRTIPSLRPYDSVEVIYRMMNTIVVSLMKSCDDSIDKQNGSNTLLYASEKAVTSYCLLLSLLMCLCRAEPRILSSATSKLRQFIQDPKTRLKQSTSDLGELIIVITLVLLMPPVNVDQPITWENIRGPFLQEAFTRNVRWVLQRAPDLEVMETGPSDYRVGKTFQCSQTSLRLIMFQITFLNAFLEKYGAEIRRLDENYGFADKGMPERMVKEIKEIYDVRDWPKFFQKVHFGKTLSKGQFSDMLRETVQESCKKGYHRPAISFKLRELARMRVDLKK